MNERDDRQFGLIANLQQQEFLKKQYWQDAISFIEECFTGLGPAGANDAEPGLLRDLIEKLERKEIDPKKARAEAQKIIDSKQDYH